MTRLRPHRFATRPAAAPWRAVVLACSLLAATVVAWAGGSPQPGLEIAQRELAVAEPHTVTLRYDWSSAAGEFVRIRLDDVAGHDATSTWTLTLAGAPSVRGGVLTAPLTLTGYEFGEAVLAGIEIVGRDRDSQALTVTPVPPLTVTFAPTIPPDAVPAEAMSAPVDVPPTFLEAYGRRIGWALVALAAGLMLIPLLTRLLAPRPVPYVPEDEWAIRELDALRGHPLESQHDIEAFHFRLAEVLRLYCGRRWVFMSARMTTYELEQALKSFAPDIADAQRADLMQLFEDADMVKFARESASKLTCADRLKRGEVFVKATRFTMGAGGAPPAQGGGVA